MIVYQQAGGGALVQDQLHHFAWVNACAIDGAAKKFHVFNNAMTLVEQDDPEHFVVEIAQPHGQVLAHLVG